MVLTTRGFAKELDLVRATVDWGQKKGPFQKKEIEVLAQRFILC